jgi:acetyltransferase
MTISTTNGLHESNVENSLSALFLPQSIAFVGATDRPGSVGYTVLKNLKSVLNGGRRVYPVNPKRKEIGGLQCYAGLAVLPESPDLVVVATPAATVPAVVSEAVKCGAKSLVVISAGYRERGAEGASLEQKIANELAGSGVRLIGPNCLGIMNPSAGLNATFSESMALPGNVAFLSQSGALCTAILDWSLEENVGFSAFVSTGSMLDVGWGDLIRYFGCDRLTQSILLYIESIQDGADFLAAAKAVSPHKPIIAIKAGRTMAAARAAASHTGAMTGNDAVLDAAFAACGVLRVDKISDLFYMAEVLSKQPRPKGPRLTIVTNAGGPGVLATDALIESGCELTVLGNSSQIELNKVLPPHWSHANPIDILGDADPRRYEQVLNIAAADPNSDGLLVVLAPQGMTDPRDCAAIVARSGQGARKPILASWMGGRAVRQGVELLNQANIPTFSYPDTASRAFAYMWEYTKLQALVQPELVNKYTVPENARQRIKQIIATAKNRNRVLLTEHEAKQVLLHWGISVVPTRLAIDAAEAVSHAASIGYPVVLKLHSFTITHKSDVGGVHLNLNSAAEVERAFCAIQHSVGGKGKEAFKGVTVQPMFKEQGYELILGGSTDPQFGPVVLFGSGGQLTEVFQDISLALPPLNQRATNALIERTKISKALQGTRGRPPVEHSRLIEVIQRFAQMLEEVEDIVECDINPLLANATSIIALDVRIVLKPSNRIDGENGREF